MKFSDRLRARRKIKGITQQAVATVVGVSKVAVSRWELGHSIPGGDTLDKLAEVLECGSRWLLSGEEVEGINDIVMVSFYKDINASAGNGFMNENEIKEKVPLPKKIIENQFDKESICCIRVSGNSMEPVLNNGAIIALNLSAKVVKDGLMYVIRQSGLLRVKILIETPDTLIVRSYNKEFSDEVYQKKGMSDFDVIGQVFWYSSYVNI